MGVQVPLRALNFAGSTGHAPKRAHIVPRMPYNERTFTCTQLFMVSSVIERILEAGSF